MSSNSWAAIQGTDPSPPHSYTSTRAHRKNKPNPTKQTISTLVTYTSPHSFAVLHSVT